MLNPLFKAAQDWVIFSPSIKRVANRALTRRFIVENPLYRHLYGRKMSEDMRRGAEKPLLVRIENTNRCHADCVFCPHRTMKRSRGAMDMDLYRSIVDQAKEMGVPRLILHGFGEPLLDKAFFERLLYAHERGISYLSTNTNAAFLDEEKAKNILRSPLDEIYISFDAATAEAYRRIRPGLDFDRVEANIERLAAGRRSAGNKGPRIYLSFVQCPENEAETDLFLSKWSDRVDGISVSLLHNWGASFDFHGRPEGHCYIRRDPCRSLWTQLDIHWQGKAVLCCYDYESTIELGDLRTQSLEEIWQGPAMRHYRALHRTGRFEEISLCRGCNVNCHHRSPWWLSK